LVISPSQGLIAGVVDDTGDNFSPVSLTPLNSLSAVSLTPAINIHSQISPRIFKKIKTAPMEYLGAWGTLIHEKT
jgi:hypothetical protein